MIFRTCLVAIIVTLVSISLSCKKENGSTGSSSAAQSDSHEGQGEVVSTDPAFEIKLKIGDAATEFTFASQQLAIYESRPAKENQTQRPQGFELRGENFVLAGTLPDGLKVAPQRKYEMLLNQSLKIMPRGGDPSLQQMSKLTTSDGKVFVAKSGTITPTKAFNRGDAYAGVSGSIECELQEIKLGNPDDPNNKGDQPVGDPIKAAGTFTAKATTYAFEQL